MCKSYSDSYLLTKTKKSLIGYLRTAEHNCRVAEETIDQQAKNYAELLEEERTKAIDEFMCEVKRHHYLLCDKNRSTDFGMFTYGLEQVASELKQSAKSKLVENTTVEESTKDAEGGDGGVKETFYLFKFVDGSYYEMTCAFSFKDAVWEMAKYTGSGSELLRKSLKGFKEEDTKGIIDIFNHFSTCAIQKIYVVEKVFYDVDAKGGAENE